MIVARVSPNMDVVSPVANTCSHVGVQMSPAKPLPPYANAKLACVTFATFHWRIPSKSENARLFRNMPDMRSRFPMSHEATEALKALASCNMESAIETLLMLHFEMSWLNALAL